MAIRETGRWPRDRQLYSAAASPAEQAGIQLSRRNPLAERQEHRDAVSATVPWSSPFSSDDAFAACSSCATSLRFSPIGTEVEVEYKNPGDFQQHHDRADDRSGKRQLPLLVVTRGAERAGAARRVQRARQRFRLRQDLQLLRQRSPVASSLGTHDPGAQRQPGSGLIIDMRQNGGGSGFLARPDGGLLL